MIKAKDNPFRVERVREVLPFDPRLLGTSWEEVLARLEALGGRGAVTGPHGSGKTAFLDALEERLAARGRRVRRVFLNREQRSASGAAFAAIEAGFTGFVLLDGCEQMGWRAWRRFRKRCERRCEGLVVTQHAEGRLPALLCTRTSAEMFAGFVRRVAGDGMFSREECDLLYRRHGGNVRAALRECYDSVGVLR